MSLQALSRPRGPRGRGGPAGPSAPAVPGLLVGAPVSSPVPGRPVAWWALDEQGRDVVVQRVRPAGGTGVGLAGLDEARLRRALPHPHLVPLVAVVRCREGAVQVLGPAPGGSLGDILGGGGTLRPGEVATLVAGLGTALAALHEEGLVHGEVDAAGVLVDERGMPVLLGWGTARPVPARRADVRRRELRAGPPGAAQVVAPGSDVRALARLGLAALGGPAAAWCAADRTLHAVLLQAADADAGHAPAAVQLARDCWEAVPALPLGSAPLSPDGPAGAHAVTQRIRLGALRASAPPSGSGHGDRGLPPASLAVRSVRALTARLDRRRLRWVAAGLAAAGSVAATAVLLVGLPGGADAAAAGASSSLTASAPPVTGSTTAPVTGSTTAPVTGSTTAPVTGSTTVPAAADGPAADPRLTGDDPVAAVSALSALRTDAITRADVELLAAVDVPGSPAAEQDAALLASLDGERVEALAVRVISAAVERSTAEGTWVVAVTQASAHRRVTGTTVTEVPAGEPVRSRLLLVRDGGTWKVADVG